MTSDFILNTCSYQSTLTCAPPGVKPPWCIVVLLTGCSAGGFIWWCTTLLPCTMLGRNCDTVAFINRCGCWLAAYRTGVVCLVIVVCPRGRGWAIRAGPVETIVWPIGRTWAYRSVQEYQLYVKKTARKKRKKKNGRKLITWMVVAPPKATLCGGGLIPSITSSFVTSDCRNSGRLFYNHIRNTILLAF